MNKRKLNKRQKARIDERQRQQLEVEGVTSQVTEESLGPKTPGIISRHLGQQLDVESNDLEHESKLYRCYQRSNLPPMVCGDRVVFQPDSESTGVIVALEPRHSMFSRPNSSGELKPVASNIDLVLIVIAPVPQPFMNFIDRYLVAVESLDLTPLLIINKTDLVEEMNDSELGTIKTLYESLGYKVFEVSAITGNGIDNLKQSLHNKTSVVVGQSGVGKSSLINALSSNETAEVGDLSIGREKGTHTTTTAQLFHLDGFDLIDSPGIRKFGLWPISSEDLLEGFIEFRPFIGHCKFRDCSHHSEPGCALQEAVESGAITPQRMESYFQILQSLSGSS